MRSLPNCRIDFAAAEEMYQATVRLLPCEGGNRDHGEIIGAYLGWALDDIERLQAYIARLEAAYLQLKRQEFMSGYLDDIERQARESLEQIKAGEQG
jgi:hypothetical protein